MDIFKKHQRSATITLSIGVIMVLLAIGVLLASPFFSAANKQSPILVPQEGQYGTLSINDFSAAFAERTDKNTYYYLGLTTTGTTYVLEVGRSVHNRLTRYLASPQDWSKDRPLRLAGRVIALAPELQKRALEAYHKVNGDTAAANLTPYLFTMTNTEKPNETVAIVCIVIIVIGAIVSLGGISVRARTRKIEKKVKTKYPYYEDFLFLERHKDVDLPSQKLFIKDAWLFAEYAGLNAVYLPDVAYLYFDTVRGRYGPRFFLVAYDKTKRNKRTWLQLYGRDPDEDRAEVESVLAWVQTRYPDILIGKSQEHRAQYLALFKR